MSRYFRKNILAFYRDSIVNLGKINKRRNHACARYKIIHIGIQHSFYYQLHLNHRKRFTRSGYEKQTANRIISKNLSNTPGNINRTVKKSVMTKGIKIPLIDTVTNFQLQESKPS